MGLFNRNKEETQEIKPYAQEYIDKLKIKDFKAYNTIKEVLDLENNPEGPEVISTALLRTFRKAFGMLSSEYDLVVSGGGQKAFWERVKQQEKGNFRADMKIPTSLEEQADYIEYLKERQKNAKGEHQIPESNKQNVK